MASSSSRSEKTDKQSIHVLDFLYPPGETSENILSSITNELIRHFGNSIYVNENLKLPSVDTSRKSQTDEGKHNAGSSKPRNNLNTHHKLLDLSNYREKVVDIAVNKNYLCVLFDDGTVHRATCHVSSNFKEESPVRPAIKNEKLDRVEPLQVASDESFARSLYHSINNLGALSSPLSGRLSYAAGTQLGRSNINISGYNAGIFSNPDYGESSNAGMPVQRVISRNYSRYVPYSTNLSQARQRGIHWGHLVNVPNAGSMIYPQNSEELSQDSMEIQDNSQMDLMNNITIVSVDNDIPSEFQISGMQTTSSQPELNYSLPNTGIATPAIDLGGPLNRTDQQTTSPLLSQSPTFKSGDSSKQRDLAGPSGATNSPKKKQRDGSPSMMDVTQTFTGSMKREPLWSSALGNLQECGLMVFIQIFLINFSFLCIQFSTFFLFTVLQPCMMCS